MRLFLKLLVLLCLYLPLEGSEMKKAILPYLLPIDHPMRPVLDEIFSQSGVAKTEQSLIHAGFSIITTQIESAVVVARHPLAPGFVFKIYRDSHPNGRKNKPGWECLVSRCENTKKVSKIIHKHHLQYFTVPEKWLYLIPKDPARPRKKQQRVVLLATDMDIEDHETTKNAWKTVITPQHLDELYVILKAGYGSYCLISNIPFTKHGTFALVDLEKSKRNLDLSKVTNCFSKEMRHYWRALINP